jgi:hypothetical protein
VTRKVGESRRFLRSGIVGIVGGSASQPAAGVTILKGNDDS